VSEQIFRALLVRCLPIVQREAQMAADITRHAPLDPVSQAIHDSTEIDAERLVREIPAALGEAPSLERSALNVER
jgi:hypothetical protein